MSVPVGVFQVFERVPMTNPSVTIEGTMTVLPDTLLIDLTPGPCRSMESSPQAYLFQCSSEVRLWFDRRDPVKRNSYSVSTITYIARRRCAAYERDSSGTNRCVRYETENVEQKGSRGGRLRPVRKP